MEFNDIKFPKSKVKPISHAAVDKMETLLGTRFPLHYREYITTLGEGSFSGAYIRIYPPRRILNELTEFRELWNEYWFWDASKEVISKADAQGCIILGDTMEGDQLIFHPRSPDDIFVLPRNSEMVYRIEPGVLAIIDWLCRSGILARPSKNLKFTPFD